MTIEGEWYFLIGEAEFDPEHTTRYRFEAGTLLDAETGGQRGTYSLIEDRLRVTFDDGSTFAATASGDRVSGNLRSTAFPLNDNGDDDDIEPMVDPAVLIRA